MNSAYKNTMEALPKEFDEPLDDSFCSVGIDSNYNIGLRRCLERYKSNKRGAALSL